MSFIEKAGKAWPVALLLLVASFVGAVSTLGGGLSSLLPGPDPKLAGIDRAVELGRESLLYCLARTAPGEVDFVPATTEATVKSLMVELGVNLDVASFRCTGLFNSRDLTLALSDAVERNHDARFGEAFDLGQDFASAQYAAYYEERRLSGRSTRQAEDAVWPLARSYEKNSSLGGTELAIQSSLERMGVTFHGSIDAAGAEGSLRSVSTAHLAQDYLYESYRRTVETLRRDPDKFAKR